MRPRPLMSSALLALLVGLALAGPAQAERPRGKEGKPPPETAVEGKVLIVRGMEGGQPQLTTDDGRRLLLIGALHDELLQLSGHKVKVWGTPGPKKLMMPTFDVGRYELLDAGGGRKPAVGVLRKGAGATLVLERGRREGDLEVQASKPLRDELEKRLRCKVWLLGDLEGTTLKAFKFGWLSCNKSKSIKP